LNVEKLLLFQKQAEGHPKKRVW